MKAGEVVFQKLLDGKIQYLVPLFQRTYNWEEDQWEQLWDDLLEIYAMESPQKHFIGSIVTQPIPGGAPENASKFMLIDGQQRMTTLLLVLSVIRYRAEAKLAEEIDESCLTNKFVNDPEERFKLLPTQRDRDPFKSAMNGHRPAVPSRIWKAREYFDEQWNKGDANGDEIDVSRLKGCIVNYLDMVSISLDENDSPNRIFESLNNTGMKLSVSDLIRNYLLMSIKEPEMQEEAYRRYWYPMQQRLVERDQDLMDDFFWRYLMMDGRLPRKDETYDEVRKMLGDPSPQRTIEELNRYSTFSQHYAKLVQLDTSGLDDSLSEEIDRLNKWEVDVAYPFLMHGLNQVALGAVSPDELLEVMRMVESFVVRRTVCGVPTNRLRRIFAQMASQVDPEGFVESSKTYLATNRWPTDAEFHSAFVRFRLYVPSRLGRTRLVLTTLERSFGHKETPEMTDSITIEHILPQTLSDEWKRDLGSRALEIQEQWIDTAGNLTLTGYNSSLGNKPFCEKKTLLQKANFALSSIENYHEWNESAIEKRGDELAQRAVGIWAR